MKGYNLRAHGEAPLFVGPTPQGGLDSPPLGDRMFGPGDPRAQRSHGTRRWLAPVRDRGRLKSSFLVRLRAPQREHEPFFFNPHVTNAECNEFTRRFVR